MIIGRQGFIGAQAGGVPNSPPIPTLPTNITPVARWIFDNPSNTPNSVKDVVGVNHLQTINPLTVSGRGVSLTSGYYTLTQPIHTPLTAANKGLTIVAWVSDPTVWGNAPGNAGKYQRFSDSSLVAGAITRPTNMILGHGGATKLSAIIDQFFYKISPPTAPVWVSGYPSGNGNKQLLAISVIYSNPLAAQVLFRLINNTTTATEFVVTATAGSNTVIPFGAEYGITSLGSPTYSPATAAVGEALYEQAVYNRYLTPVELGEYYTATRGYHGV